MMSPLWQDAARVRWPWLVCIAVMAMAALWFAMQTAPAPGIVCTALLAVGTGPWRLTTVARLTVLVALLVPAVLTAVSAQRWPWAEVLVLLCWMWLSEVLWRWRTRSTVTPEAQWTPIRPLQESSGMHHLAWPLSLASPGAAAAALWCGGSWAGAALIAAGLVLVIHETGQVRRSVLAVAGGLVLMHRMVPPDSGALFLVLLPLAVPVMRAGGVTTACLFPGTVLVAGWTCGWQPMALVWSISVALAALALTGWVWDAVSFPVRPAWRMLPPSWRWFTWAKLAWDPVYRLLAEDPRPWGRVLDLGCGTGLGGVIAARRNDVQQWRGIDLDARKIAIARRVLAATPGSAGWQTLTTRLPPRMAIEDADTLLALDILHYWSFTEQSELLVWMRSRLAPHGLLWVREGTTDGTAAAQVHRGERFTTSVGLNPASALFFRSTTGWEEAFVAAGFIIVSRQAAGAANCLWGLAATRPEDLLA